MIASCFYIKISDKFNIDLCVTFLNFEVGSWPNSLRNPWIFSKRYKNILHIKITDDFDIDFCLNISNFQTTLWINKITYQKLHASCCNFIRRFSKSKSQMGFMSTFIWPFRTFKPAQNHLPYEQDNSSLINCMHHVVTLLAGSPHQNLIRAEGFQHQICLFLFLMLTL